MALGHLDLRSHTRSRGHSVAAALAYRFGARFVDERTGTIHDYTRRAATGDVAGVGFAHGAHAPRWARNDGQAFCDALERAERRCNSIVVRDCETALPHELSDDQRAALARRWAEHIAAKYDTAVAYAIHRPGPHGDARNHHVHTLIATRALGESGLPKAKLRQFHLPSRTDRGSSAEVHALRAEWEGMCNEVLAEAGIDAQIAMGQIADEDVRRPVLSRSEVAAERQAWQRRRRGRDSTQLSVSQLVVDDAPPITERGQALAAALWQSADARRQGHPDDRTIFSAVPADPEAVLAATADLETVAEPPQPKRAGALRRRRRRKRRVRTVEAPPPMPAVETPPRAATISTQAVAPPAPPPLAHALPKYDSAGSNTSAAAEIEPPAPASPAQARLPPRRRERRLSEVVAIEAPAPPGPVSVIRRGLAAIDAAIAAARARLAELRRGPSAAERVAQVARAAGRLITGTLPPKLPTPTARPMRREPPRDPIVTPPISTADAPAEAPPDPTPRDAVVAPATSTARATAPAQAPADPTPPDQIVEPPEQNALDAAWWADLDDMLRYVGKADDERRREQTRLREERARQQGEREHDRGPGRGGGGPEM